jgi:hypothetical protein
MKRGTVLICQADGGQVDGYFAHTLAGAEQRAGGAVIGRMREVGGPMIADHRNRLVERFLTTDAEWMWMVDTDMVFQPSTLVDLLAKAHWKDRPVVGALCFGANRLGTTIYPTLYWWTEDGPARGDNLDLRSVGTVEVDGTGAACLLIHRTVLEKLVTDHPPPKGPFEFTWRDTDNGPARVGEDITFCLRVKLAGFPIFVDCDNIVGHMKPVILDLDYFEREQLWHRLNTEALLMDQETSSTS